MYRNSAHDLHKLFTKGDISAQEIAEKTLARLEKHDKKVGSFLSIFGDRLIEKAKALDLKRSSKQKLGKLAGVTLALKDNIHKKGEITTCGSKFLSNYKAVFDATITRLLEEEDALIIGKTNLDEFAMGSSTENSAYKLTHNPWNLNCSPGGSSGGSAAAVAARFCPLAFGSDTGGSIRQPAAFTGVVGFKPTYGRVSRYGLVAFGSSLDQIGPFAASVKDVALAMDVIGKHCKYDSTSLPSPSQEYLPQLDAPLKNMTIGVPANACHNLNTEARDNFYASLEILKTLGCSIIDINLNLIKHSVAIYYILATAEASTNLARFDGVRYGQRSLKAASVDEIFDFSRAEGFGAEVKRRILLGTYVLSSGYQDAYYKKAQQVRTLMIQEFNKAFEFCHAIATPTSPTTAFNLGEIQDPLQMYLQDIYTIPANLAGLPAISIPSGFSVDGKPFGLHLAGPQMHDLTILQLAHLFEKATDFNTKIPPLFDDEAFYV